MTSIRMFDLERNYPVRLEFKTKKLSEKSSPTSGFQPRFGPPSKFDFCGSGILPRYELQTNKSYNINNFPRFDKGGGKGLSDNPANGCTVILSEAKNLIVSGIYTSEILRLTPQNDVVGQPRRGDFVPAGAPLALTLSPLFIHLTNPLVSR